MVMAVNTTTNIPPAVSTTYVMTRPPGCVPATSTFTTSEIFADFLDLGPLGTAPKGVSLRVAPVCPANTHVGIAFNCFGNMAVNPQVYGPGVGCWTHANGLFFNWDGKIYTESWHVNPNSTEASGAWFDAMVIGDWIPGHQYQVDIMLYNDGHFSFQALDLSYKMNSNSKPNSTTMERFSTTNASPNDPSIPVRIRAKSVNGYTSSLGAFIAGTGSSLSVTPLAIYN